MTSEVLVEKLDIHYFRGKLYFKKGTHFISDENLLLRDIDDLIRLSTNQHKQLLDLFKIKSFIQEDDELPVQIRNGYTLYENEFVYVNLSFTPSYFNI